MPTSLGRSTNVKIGTTVNNVEDVLWEPHVEYMPGAKIEQNICGQDNYTGSARCRWTYPNHALTGEEFYQLQNIVGNNASASVIIDIPTQALDISTYQPLVATYQAIMHWPREGVRQTTHNRWTIEDGILFTELEPL